MRDKVCCCWNDYDNGVSDERERIMKIIEEVTDKFNTIHAPILLDEINAVVTPTPTHGSSESRCVAASTPDDGKCPACRKKHTENEHCGVN